MNPFLLLAMICISAFCLTLAELLYVWHLGSEEFVSRKQKTDKDFGTVQLSYLVLTLCIVLIGSLCGAVGFFLIYYGQVKL